EVQRDLEDGPRGKSLLPTCPEKTAIVPELQARRRGVLHRMSAQNSKELASYPRLRSMTVFSTQGEAAIQEDYVLAKKERGLFVVGDGFGGGENGANASRIACESVLGFLDKEAGDLEATLPFVLRKYYSLAGNVLFNTLVHANKKVLKANQGKN